MCGYNGYNAGGFGTSISTTLPHTWCGYMATFAVRPCRGSWNHHSEWSLQDSPPLGKICNQLRKCAQMMLKLVQTSETRHQFFGGGKTPWITWKRWHPFPASYRKPIIHNLPSLQGSHLWWLRLCRASELSLQRWVLPRPAPRCVLSQAKGWAKLCVFLQGVCWNCVLLGGVTGASDKGFGENTVSLDVSKTRLGRQPPKYNGWRLAAVI